MFNLAAPTEGQTEDEAVVKLVFIHSSVHVPVLLVILVIYLIILIEQRTLEREIRGCQTLIIWTDCDREGENIGYEVIQVCRAGRITHVSKSLGPYFY